MSYVSRSIEDAQLLFANDQLSLEHLEAEVEFWLRVERCRFCTAHEAHGGSLCSSHYGEMVGR